MKQLSNMLPKKPMPLPLDWLLASDQPITEETLQAAQDAQKYPNRDKFPDTFQLRFADLYHELTGQLPAGRMWTDWTATFDEWHNLEFTEDNIRAGYQEADKMGSIIGRPGSLTTFINGAKTKQTKPAVLQVNQKAIESSKKEMTEKWDAVEYKKPSAETLAEVRARVKAATAAAKAKLEAERRV